MKIRLKFGGKRELLTIDGEGPAVTLPVLKDAIKVKLQLTSDAVVEISLNGKDVLQGDELTLDELGIVSGDLVVVLTPPSDDEGKNQPQNVPDAVQVEKKDVAAATAEKSDSKLQSDESIPAKAEEVAGAVEMEVEERMRDPEVKRYLSEPMLCRDSTRDEVPQRLVVLYNDASVQQAADALCVLLHILMLETGFVDPGDSATTSADNPHPLRMPPDWKSPGAYRFVYHHISSPGVHFKLICVTLGRKMIVHGCAEIPEKDDSSLQLQINTEDFVSGIKAAAHETYRNLPKLSQIFKDKISYRLIQDSRQMLELPQLSGFVGLFPELKFAVMQYLDFRSLVRLSATCVEMKTMARDPSLWRRLYLLEFGKRGDESLHQDWLKYFKDAYIRRKEREEMIHRPTFIPGQPPFPQGIFGPPLPYAPGAPSGIIGGDYDIDPFGFHGNVVPDPMRPFRPPRPGFPNLPGMNRPSRGNGGLGGFGPKFPRFF